MRSKQYILKREIQLYTQTSYVFAVCLEVFFLQTVIIDIPYAKFFFTKYRGKKKKRDKKPLSKSFRAIQVW